MPRTRTQAPRAELLRQLGLMSATALVISNMVGTGIFATTGFMAGDLGSPALPQLVLAQLIAAGELERHIRLVRQRQRQRRDALLQGLREYLPQARVQGVAAGLHLLITFGGEADDVGLASAIERTGVLVHPLSWHQMRPGPPGLVLGYAAHTPGQLREAARRIASVLG